jgi:predicted metal-dependent enzyme (double-stranded beta helix superfamily)
MSAAQERHQAIAEALDQVRAIEAEQGVSKASLEAIRSVMIGVASRPELFPADEFPLPDDGSGERFDVLSVDDDGRYELYLEVANKDVSTPPHDHTTWAVVTGICGLELNKVYEGDGGPKGEAPLKVGHEVEVKAGTGVCLMPDDFHSIHIKGGELNMHLHLYGLGFEHLKGRRMFDMEKGEYRGFEYMPD